MKIAGRRQKSQKFGRQIDGPRPPGLDRSKTGLRSAGKRIVKRPVPPPASLRSTTRQTLCPLDGSGNVPSNSDLPTLVVGTVRPASDPNLPAVCRQITTTSTLLHRSNQ
ncbi:hypothetical protein PGTUg99_020274 [Puccinia graminis f. sp. tritici]|uniref:Uncharacterized protein n=1 Tax=Puccinia graminis f. sp. tritici TaxID=56615 RepID=A0A5B0S0U5_PUCGR|nr:hypothetical protein PGTUg99_020274 [Puccinia graminis f. sp. tritici]